MLSYLQILHTSNLGDAHPNTHILSSEIQQLQAQLAGQKQQYAVLQHQLDQIESAINLTGRQPAYTGVTTYTDGIDSALPSFLPTDAANSLQHKLAVLVPYRDRQEHLAQLVSRLQEYLTVSQHSQTCICCFSGFALFPPHQ